MASLNPYLSRKSKSIVFNVQPTQDGWDVQVQMPPSVPTSDRIKVLLWMKDYKAQVRMAHPYWSTVLHPSEERYVLEIRRTNSEKELVETEEDLTSICGEMLEYA